jgi:hypothetical protein
MHEGAETKLVGPPPSRAQEQAYLDEARRFALAELEIAEDFLARPWNRHLGIHARRFPALTGYLKRLQRQRQTALMAAEAEFQDERRNQAAQFFARLLDRDHPWVSFAEMPLPPVPSLMFRKEELPWTFYGERKEEG